MRKNILCILLMGLFGFMMHSCTGQKGQKDNFPLASDYPGYDLVDARHVQNITLSAKQGGKFAIVVRDLAVTAFTNLETPVYNKSYVVFEGVERCCLPQNGLIGASSLLVYKFQALRPTTKPSNIKLIARHKGLDMTTAHYDSDLVTNIDLEIVK